MIRRCSWCGKFQGLRAPYLDMSTTHGICEPCQVKIGDVPETHAPSIDVFSAAVVLIALTIGITAGAEWAAKGFKVEGSGPGLMLRPMDIGRPMRPVVKWAYTTSARPTRRAGQSEAK